MLEKLKELLGEELANKVTTALGEIELAIMNDGTVVKADKYETLKAEHQVLTVKYDNDISGLNSKLDNAMTNAADYDSLNGTLEVLKAENLKIAEDYRLETLKIKKSSAVDRALLTANVKDSYIDMVKTQLNMDQLNFDGENLIGLNDSITQIQTKYPDLFGEVKKVGLVIDNGMTQVKGKKAQLIEQYNTAQSQKDVKKMASLDKEIRAIKE